MLKLSRRCHFPFKSGSFRRKVVTKHCPKCDADISETYQPAEPDVGIMSGGWYCDPCDLAVEEDYEREPMEDDVFPSTRHDITNNGRCQYCNAPLVMGCGLAGGGGIGLYLYCPDYQCGK